MLTIQRSKPLTLHVLLPGVTESVGRWTRDYGDLPRTTALATIFAKGRRRALPVSGIDATLCSLFGLSSAPDRDLPLGALRRYGVNGRRDAGFWLCADPVNLRADVAHVFLTNGDSLNITRAEADNLAGLLRSHFSSENWTLEIGSPEHWHLRLPSPALIRTHPLRAVMGKAIEGHLPTGQHARRWRGLINEMQMLFHSAANNLERQRRGAPSINGVWIAGVGELPKPELLRRSFNAVWSQDPVAKALSRLTDTPVNSPPQSFATILEGDSSGVHLAILESLLAPASYDEFATWSERLEALESTWFGPILQALRAGKLAACHIYDCAAREFIFTRADRARFWKNIKSLHACLGNIR